MDIDNIKFSQQAKIFFYVKCVHYSFRQIIPAFIPKKSYNQLTKKNIRLILIILELQKLKKKRFCYVSNNLIKNYF